MNETEVLNIVKGFLKEIEDDEQSVQTFISGLDNLVNPSRNFMSLDGLSHTELVELKEKLHKTTLLGAMPESAVIRINQKILRINQILGEPN